MSKIIKFPPIPRRIDEILLMNQQDELFVIDNYADVKKILKFIHDSGIKVYKDE